MKRVLIVGNGVEAWMAAAVLATAGKGVLQVQVTGEGLPPTGRIAALPALRTLHARLGVTEETLARAIGARPRLAARYGEAVEPFGETGAMFEGLAFHHYWLATGQDAPLADWSLAAQAAARGRFSLPDPDPRSPLSTLDYGLSLDAAAYAGLLKATALKAGATVGAGEAELVVETAAGPYDHDWSAWLPTGVALAEDDLITGFQPAPLTAGRRDKAVDDGRVFIGAAYAAIGAGDGGDLLLLQTVVSRLVALFPDTPAAADEFNRLTTLATERARDMAILRWGALDAPPQELAWKIAQFESRGRVVTYDEEAWPEQSWVHAFLARGFRPKRWDPLAERAPTAQMREMLNRMKTVMEQTAEAMPRV